MGKIELHYVTDESGNRSAVVVPMEEWLRLQAALEEVRHAVAAGQAVRTPSGSLDY